jgi:RimJ/RimL family protein N-acetyltransferase
MKPGTIIRTFTAKDGRRVVLRTPTWNDLDDLLSVINSLVEEQANILVDEKVSREDEVDWLSKALARLEKDETIYVVAEVDGKVVGNSELGRKTNGRDKHVGTIGIAIRDGFREIGIGTEMIKTQIDQAKSMGLKVLTLSAFANNERAHHVYQKVGFADTGRIPKKFFKEGNYIDETLMAKVLE